MLTMALGLSLMGMTYGPLGTVLSELFPTSVRYTGSSLTFNFAGIFGASLAPYIATWLAKTYGLQYVGYYLSAAAVVTLIGLVLIRETRDEDLVVGGDGVHGVRPKARSARRRTKGRATRARQRNAEPSEFRCSFRCEPRCGERRLLVERVCVVSAPSCRTS